MGLSIIVHSFNPNAQKTEAGGLQVKVQSGLCREILTKWVCKQKLKITFTKEKNCEKGQKWTWYIQESQGGFLDGGILGGRWRLNSSSSGPDSSPGAWESTISTCFYFVFLSPVLLTHGLISGHQMNKTPTLTFSPVLFSLPAIHFSNLSFLPPLFQLLHVQWVYQSSAEKQNQWNMLPLPLMYLKELAQVMWRLASLRSVGQTGRREV